MSASGHGSHLSSNVQGLSSASDSAPISAPSILLSYLLPELIVGENTATPSKGMPHIPPTYQVQASANIDADAAVLSTLTPIRNKSKECYGDLSEDVLIQLDTGVAFPPDKGVYDQGAAAGLTVVLGGLSLSLELNDILIPGTSIGVSLALL